MLLLFVAFPVLLLAGLVLSLALANAQSPRARAVYRVLLALRWTIPAFYLTILVACLHLFFTHTYTPSSLLVVGPVLAAHAFATYKVLTVEAVRVTPANVAALVRAYPYDYVLFYPNDCSTCGTAKPARLKHCLVCNHCYGFYDHHCIWIARCVGLGNYRWFAGFLLTNLVVLLVGLVLCWLRLRTETPAAGLLYHRYKVATFASYSASVTAVLALLCFLFLLVVLAFSAEHVRLTLAGSTTNELDRWGFIESLADGGVLYESSPPVLKHRLFHKVDEGYETLTGVAAAPHLPRLIAANRVPRVFCTTALDNLRRRLQ